MTIKSPVLSRKESTTNLAFVSIECSVLNQKIVPKFLSGIYDNA